MLFPNLWRRIHETVARRMDRGDAAGAQKVADRYLRWRPHDPRAWTIKAGLEYTLRGAEARERVLRRGLDVNPGNDLLMTELARDAIADHRLDVAADWIRKAREGNPTSPKSYVLDVSLAWAKRDEAGFARATDQAKARLRPAEDPDAALMLATLLVSNREERNYVLSVLTELAGYDRTHYWINLLLGVLKEQEDSAASARHIELARANWPFDATHFERELATAREAAWSDGGDWSPFDGAGGGLW